MSEATHLCSYMMSVVQGLVVDEYVIVYLHSGAPQHSMPSLSTFHAFYHMVDHRWVWSDLYTSIHAILPVGYANSCSTSTWFIQPSGYEPCSNWPVHL